MSHKMRATALLMAFFLASPAFSGWLDSKAKEAGGAISDKGKEIGGKIDEYADSLVNKTKSGIGGSGPKGPKLATRKVVPGKPKISDQSGLGWADHFGNKYVYFVCEEEHQLEAAWVSAGNWEWRPISRGEYCRLSNQYLADRPSNGWARTASTADCNTALSNSGSEAFRCWDTSGLYASALEEVKKRSQNEMAALKVRQEELNKLSNKQITALNYQTKIEEDNLALAKKNAEKEEQYLAILQKRLDALTTSAGDLSKKFIDVQSHIMDMGGMLRAALSSDEQRLQKFRGDNFALIAKVIAAKEPLELREIPIQRQNLGSEYQYYCLGDTESAVQLNKIMEELKKLEAIIYGVERLISFQHDLPIADSGEVIEKVRLLQDSMEKTLSAHKSTIRSQLWIFSRPDICANYYTPDNAALIKIKYYASSKLAGEYLELALKIENILADSDAKSQAIEFHSRVARTVNEIMTDFRRAVINGNMNEVYEIFAHIDELKQLISGQLGELDASVKKHVDETRVNQQVNDLVAYVSDPKYVSPMRLNLMTKTRGSDIVTRIYNLRQTSSCSDQNLMSLLHGNIFNDLPVTTDGQLFISYPPLKTIDEYLLFHAVLAKSQEQLSAIEKMCGGNVHE